MTILGNRWKKRKVEMGEEQRREGQQRAVRTVKSLLGEDLVKTSLKSEV